MKEDKEIKQIVKDKYKKIAMGDSNCSCNRGCKSVEDISKTIGYSAEELKIVGEANLGLGCGNPLALGRIKEGDVVLDLGSGAGMDAILAAKKVGGKGKVIGVDMTEEMIDKARENAKKQGIKKRRVYLGGNRKSAT